MPPSVLEDQDPRRGPRRQRPPGIIEIAETQVRPVLKSAYCRTLDRLHLAAMQALGVHRLLTNDEPQARAARGLGFETTLPR